MADARSAETGDIRGLKADLESAELVDDLRCATFSKVQRFVNLCQELFPGNSTAGLRMRPRQRRALPGSASPGHDRSLMSPGAVRPAKSGMRFRATRAFFR